MRIKMLSTLAGPDANIMAGAIVNMDEDKAQQLVDLGYAEKAPAPAAAAEPETAALEQPEKAVKKAPRKRTTRKPAAKKD